MAETPYWLLPWNRGKYKFRKRKGAKKRYSKTYNRFIFKEKPPKQGHVFVDILLNYPERRILRTQMVKELKKRGYKCTERATYRTMERARKHLNKGWRIVTTKAHYALLSPEQEMLEPTLQDILPPKLYTLYKLIRDNPGATIKDIMAENKHTPNNARVHVHLLREELPSFGLNILGYGRYYLVDIGIEEPQSA